MPAAFAFQPDIRAEAYHRPLVGAAGVGFPQTQVIVQLQIGEHGTDYTAGEKATIYRQVGIVSVFSFAFSGNPR